jgi:hypothetical protein
MPTKKQTKKQEWKYETDVISNTNTALQLQRNHNKQTKNKDDMTTKTTTRAHTKARSRCVYLKHIQALQITNEDPRQKLIITLINPPKSLTQKRTITTQPDKWTLPVGISHICLCSDWLRPNSKGKDPKLRLTACLYGPRSKNILKSKGIIFDQLGRMTLILEAVKNSKKNPKIKKRTDLNIMQTETINKTEKIINLEVQFINEVTEEKLCTCIKYAEHAQLKNRLLRVKTAQEQKHIASLTKIPRDENDTHVPQQADNVQRTANPNTSPVALLQANSEVQYT